MVCHHEALYQACFAVAQKTHFEFRPVDVSQIEGYAQRLLAVALNYVKACGPQDGLENLIIRAIYYIEQAHAIPPIGNNVHWFDNMSISVQF